MGTRADFYVGRGVKAEWLGSVAWDGHPENFKPILAAKTVKAFRTAVAKELKGRDDATLPTEGWPWPWDSSHLTDYSYAFDKGEVLHTEHSKSPDAKCWVRPGKFKTDDEGYVAKHLGICEWPDMTSRKNVKMPGAKGSGVMLFGARGVE